MTKAIGASVRSRSENTALVVRGERAEVIGLGTVSVYDKTNRGASNPVRLRTGDKYDLAARRKW